MKLLSTLACCMILTGAGTALAQNKVLSLDGFGQHALVPHHPSHDTSTAFTVEYWASIIQFSGRPVSKRSGDGGQFNTQANVQCGPAWGAELFGVGTNDPTCLRLPPVQSHPGLFGTWNHFAVTWSAASRTIRFYVNGVLVKEVTNSGTTMRQSDDPLRFGDFGVWSNQDFRGRLDNIRLWNVARTQFELASTATTSLSPSQAQAMVGLIGSWSFDAGTVTDATGRNNGTLNGGASIIADSSVYAHADCDADGLLDAFQIAISPATDADADGILDACECVSPTVTTQPLSTTACIDAAVSLVAGFSGSSPSVQWRRNGHAIAGATALIYTIQFPTPADAGSYDCVATNACGSVTTDVASLTVLTSPIITQHPTDTVRRPGETAVFDVVPSDPAAAFQWRRDGIPLENTGRVSGANAPTLAIADLSVSDQGFYDCVVANACGGSTSSPARLHVRTTETPVSIVSTLRQVSASTSYCGNATLNNVNAGDWSVSLAASSPFDCGLWPDHEASHTSAVWPWRMELAADLRANRNNMLSSSATDSTFDVTFDLTDTVRAAFSGRWNTNFDGFLWPFREFELRFERLEPDPEVLVASAFSADWQPDGTSVCHCGDSMQFTTRMTPGRYRLRAYGAVGASSAAEDQWLHMRVTLNLDEACQFTVDPLDRHLRQGEEAMFSAEFARSDASLQWRRDGLDLVDDGRLSGSTTGTLTIRGAGPFDQGVYECVATSVACQQVISASATLSCRPEFETQPEGGVFGSGAVIYITAGESGDAATTFAWLKDGLLLTESATFVGTRTRMLTINSQGPEDGGHYSAIATNSCGSSVTESAAILIRCTGDFNDDGGIDGSDVSSFFEAWESGDSLSDVNSDGGVDGLDLFLFFDRWSLGC